MKQRPNIVLIGFQTAGKTTIGKKLANSFQRSFIDTDQLIESTHTPLTCQEVYLHYGESYFRQQENQACFSFSQRHHLIIAVGGGTALHHFNLKTQMVYLKTSLPILKKRIEMKPLPPAYLKNHSLEKLYEQRIAYYEKWATQTIEMNCLTIEEAVQQIGEKCGL